MLRSLVISSPGHRAQHALGDDLPGLETGIRSLIVGFIADPARGFRSRMLALAIRGNSDQGEFTDFDLVIRRSRPAGARSRRPGAVPDRHAGTTGLDGCQASSTRFERPGLGDLELASKEMPRGQRHAADRLMGSCCQSRGMGV